MKSIPEGQLIRVQPSSLYIDEFYSSTIPTMDEITRLATPKPRNDYTLYHGSPITYPKTKLYQPLLLASNAPEIPTESDEDDEQSKTIGDCVWDCFLKQLGLNVTMGVAGSAGAIGSMIPKSLVRDTAKSAKAGKFVPIAKDALGFYSRITSIPSTI
ncbi:hypothetical protein [Commensalibacter communis]|uniref:hypothetical protein n=1 Tax=Commensalibacter communis TaxID=2972786 RepID=UPI0022FF777B|nr:hypothetical protein [Commensalibacter communis]CAI3953199.1 unnamed protein product [Commensalibacter communis]CAI3953229.1 unnamed protein product [Commensalibacter communis]